MRKFLTRALGGAAVIGMLLVSPATQVAADNNNDNNNGYPVQAVRAATAQFHDTARADAAGWHKALWCFDKPGVGGMGWHFINGPLINGTVNATQPQALVYEVDGDELELVAVEYVVPYTAANANNPPRMWGQTFLHVEALGIWALHAWIWKSNPLGMHAAYNPRVELCPGTPSED
jgi:hypothetical protein